MKKTEVYSWRINSETKAALEHAAKAQHTSMAKLLDRIVKAWLDRSFPDDDEAYQKRLHDAAEEAVGTVRGGDPHRAEQAATRLREKLRRTHAGPRPD